MSCFRKKASSVLGGPVLAASIAEDNLEMRVMHFENILSQKNFLPTEPVKKDIWLSPKFTAALICLESGLEIEPDRKSVV